MLKRICCSAGVLFGILLSSTLQAQKRDLSSRRQVAQEKKLLPELHTDDLTCEYKRNPLSVDELNPRLSWKLYTNARDVRQVAYEIRVSDNAMLLAKGRNVLWTSGRIMSDQSILVPYKGPELTSREKCYWQVRVWTNKKQVSPWSSVNYWKMGLLSHNDWSARWVLDPNKADTNNSPSPMFRKVFNLKKPVKAAYLYITAHGLYEAQLNGTKVGDDYFSPGFTSYHKRLQYQVYDVASQLKKGDNAIGVTLGDGWYRGYTYDRKIDAYGKRLAVLFQLEVVYTNGERQTITSDKNCRVSYGPIRSSSFFDGELYDANKEQPGWSTVMFDAGKWDTVRTNDSIRSSHLIATYGPPVTKHERFVPIKVLTTPQGDRVIDFGQNLVGHVKFTVKGKAGDTMKLYHGEVLDKDGNFYNKNLRTAKQEIQYVFKGGDAETYEPHFTFQGFRYVKVVGYNGPIDSTNFEADALYSDMDSTGTFSTSNPLINQLQHNIQWSQKGNFIDIPTDCPQRDERMGWSGDAQAFAQTATFNMDVAEFFTKWLKDLSADQLKDGAVPYVIPNILDTTYVAASGWSDAATIIPWTIYLAYGDKQILQQQYESMRAWVGYMQAHSRNNLWDTGNHFGDWLFYSGTDYEDGAALTDKNLIAQTFYAHSTQLLINAAIILGKENDVRKYTDLLAKIKKAFQTEYVTPAGRMISGTQTSYVLALNFDMLPEELRASAASRLVQNIEEYDGHVTTGFLGTPYICHVLSRFGYTDVAYALLMNETYPSWLYPVKNGATTIWERLDGIKPDKTFEDPGMNSFNHYAYGAIGDWMYSDIAGINVDEEGPGFNKMLISPQPGGGLTSEKAELETPYGTIRSAWNIGANNAFTMDVTIPANTTARVTLPSTSGLITESGVNIIHDPDITGLDKIGNNEVQLTLGSGTYHFAYTYKPVIIKRN
jgi:alpha-L-rhamnosidase